MAYGDISTVIDSLIWNDSDNIYGSGNLIHIADDVYLGNYSSDDSGTHDGHLFTIKIDSDGNVDSSTTDDWQFESSYHYWGCVTRIKETNNFICAYKGPSSDGFMFTFSVADNGTITKSKIDTWEFDPTYSAGRAIVHHINGTKYMLAYSDTDNDVQVISFDIDDDGNIDTTTGVIDQLEIGGSDYQNHDPGVVQHNDTGTAVQYVIAFNDEEAARDGWASVVEIDYDGTNITENDSVEFDSGGGHWTSICKAKENGDDTIYSISYSGYATFSAAATVEVNEAGTSITFKDKEVLSSSYGLYTSCLYLEDGTVLAMYIAATGTSGTLETLSIASNGTITSLNTKIAESNTFGQNNLNYVQGSNDKIIAYYQGAVSSGNPKNAIRTYSISGVDTGKGSETETFNSISSIYKEETETFNSDSVIWGTETDTFNSISSIYEIETETFNSTSLIYKTKTNTFNSDSVIWDTETDTFNSISSIYKTETDTFNSISSIYKTETETFNSTSLIYKTKTNTFTSTSVIWTDTSLAIDILNETAKYDVVILNETND